MAIEENFATLLEVVADTAAETTAIVQGERATTWAQLDDRGARLARRLADHGVVRGERVGIGLYNGPEYLETLLAVMKLRAVPVNINYRYRERELAELLDYAAPSALVFDASLSARLATVIPGVRGLRALVRVGPVKGTDPLPPPRVDDYEETLAGAEPMTRIERSGDDQWLMFTGGTTGRPKGVLSRHRGLLRSALANGYDVVGVDAPADLSDLSARTRTLLAHERRPISLVAPPLMHATGLYTALGTLLAAGTVVFLPSRSFDAAEMARTLQRREVTDLCLVGDAFARPFADVLDEAAAAGRAYDLRALRRVLSVGVQWSPEVKERLLRHCDALLQDVLAASEGGPFAMSLTTRAGERAEDEVTSRFALMPDARVITEHGSDVVPGSGQVGHLAAPADEDVRYLDDPDASATTFRDISGRRYCVPGDLARIEADGSLTLLGRGSRVINTGGEKVFAEEVEQVVAQHPSVSDVNVVGVPDERWGERIVAVVATREGAELTGDVVSGHVAEQLADHKRPRAVVFVREVRRSATGKADLAWAREVARSGSAE